MWSMGLEGESLRNIVFETSPWYPNNVTEYDAGVTNPRVLSENNKPQKLGAKNNSQLSCKQDSSAL